MKDYYQFKPEDAERFAAEHNIKCRRRGNELLLKWCPYCMGNGKDKETFSINLGNGQFNCLRASCGAKGNMISLSRDFGFSLSPDSDTYYGIKWQRFKTFTKKAEDIEVPDSTTAYFATRGIGPETVKKYHITARKDDEKIIVFPFYDPDNQLQFLKYRNTQFKKEDGGSKEWCESGCKPILFGMAQCNLENKTLIMTEGQIDSLSVAEAGYENAVSVPNGKNGFTWVPHCWDWLQSFEKLIVFGDFERGAMTLLADMKTRFQGQVLKVRPEDYRDCKDANEILMKYGIDGIRQCIENAECDSDPHIIRMADVEPVDAANMEHFSTGFTDLDSLIGGFYFGQVILITGKRGNGKSTLASQFLSKALNAGYTCFAYSGELIHSNFREWIDRQLAGPSCLEPVKLNDDKQDWTVKDWKRRQLHDWYYHTMWLQDDGNMTSDEETESLLQTVEKAAKEYGIRVILLDNLMTALDENLSADLNRLQSNFVRGLARIARAYHVVIFLIAHPRKRRGDVTDFDADDVMGSGNITNAVDVVLQYESPGKQFGLPDRILAVKKNRLFGELHDGISTWFDPASKRISQTKDDFSWETDGQIFEDVSHDVDLPWGDE